MTVLNYSTNEKKENSYVCLNCKGSDFERGVLRKSPKGDIYNLISFTKDSENKYKDDTNLRAYFCKNCGFVATFIEEDDFLSI